MGRLTENLFILLLGFETRYKMKKSKINDVVKYYIAVCKILFAVDKTYTLLLLLMAIILGFFPGILTIILQKLLNSLQQVEITYVETIKFVLIYLGVDALIGILNILQTYLSPILKTKLYAHVSSSVLNKAIKLNLKDFENSEVYDKIQRAQGETGGEFFDFFVSFLSIFQLLFQIIIQSVILLTWRSWVIALIILVSIFNSICSIMMNKKRYDMLLKRTENERKKWYYQYLLTKDVAYKEIKVFNLSSFFINKFKRIIDFFLNEDKLFYKKFSLIKFFNMLLDQISTGVIFFLIINDAINRYILIGDAITYIRCVGQIMGNISGILAQFEFIYKKTLFLKLYFDLMEIQIPEEEGIEIDEIKKIELKNLSYKYADKNNYVLYNINLKIDGNVILVGRNGSGKSTLIKLLAGLYDDYEGNIYINDINLKKIKKSSLQSKMSILFQDYNKYEMSVRDNIALGNISEATDSDILDALKKMKSPFSTFNDLHQQLGVWFKEGQQISGGEWLKIALCKIFIRKSDFYILDEPNAALDAVSEKEILNYMDSIINNKIAVIITHRMENIPYLNKKILVLKEGKIVASGFHDELIKTSLDYKELYYGE